jgi:neopullulanase
MKNLMLSLMACAVLATSAHAENFRARLPQDEVIYFLLADRFENGDVKNDKGGLTGDRLQTGFDPTHKGFYHGGDLKGVIKRLDYIQSLGATAIWLAPIFKNKPVQGAPGQETAAYHGYWVTDFTTIDPHLGTEADFKALVDAAHARNLKVYMDIITNHTADVISYKECPQGCSYRSRADYPYSQRARDGAAINSGFNGDQVHTLDNFKRLTDFTYAYTPIIPAGQERLKKPDWLNEVRYYHNRGNTTFSGENSTMGDFVGLDDLMTEDPHVVNGFIDIYGRWIDKYAVDGFRIDTAKHVNPEFWATFVPAIKARALAKGIPNFHIFGEIYISDVDVALLATHTHVDKLPTVLDFAFQSAMVQTVAGKQGTDLLAKLYAGDSVYAGGAATAQQLPTFLGNHDAGRFAFFVRKENPQASDAEILKRTLLGHAMMMTLRGVPTIYSGDEQGFIGDGGDQDAREDMFASNVAVYNDNKILGTTATTAQANFEQNRPLYQLISKLSQLRHKMPALRRGDQTIRNYSDKPGVFAVSRRDRASGNEALLIFNTSADAINMNVEIDYATRALESTYGMCPATPRTPGSVSVSLNPFDFIICTLKK